MKKIFSLTTVLIILNISGTDLAAQTPPPPPSGAHGLEGNQPTGGNAPLGSGIGFLLLLGTGYAVKALADSSNKRKKLKTL